ncbi:MAG: LamG-like jellyroll fold domain-containing protein [Nanoarchaeota archaeon]|nr:LamG-like jellyroll fold domain-containing protein [Nanoarchaeota archaeon]
MGRQSVHHKDKDVVFNEVFNSSAEVVKNGGEIGGSPTFDNGVITTNGSDNYVEYPNNYGDAYSFRMKVTPTNTIDKNTTSVVPLYIERGDDYAYNGVVFGNFTGYFSNEVVALSFRDGVNQYRTGWTSVSGELTAGQEYDLFFSWDSSNSRYDIYIDGVKKTVTSGSSDGHVPLFTADRVMIGVAYQGGYMKYFAGSFDLVTIYNRSLSSDEVSALYKNTLYQDYRDNMVLQVVGNGGAIEDLTGQQTITNNGATTGKYDSDFPVISFDGTNYAQVADSDSLSFGDGSSDSAFSISAWVKSSDLSNDFIILSKGVYNTDDEYRFIITGSKVYFQIYDESVNSCVRGAYYNTALTAYGGQWIQLVATYNGVGGSSAENGMNIYLNGTKINDSTQSTGTYVAMENLAHDVWLGRYDSDYTNGQADDTRIYNEELSAEKVARIYNSTKGRYNK